MRKNMKLRPKVLQHEFKIKNYKDPEKTRKHIGETMDIINTIISHIITDNVPSILRHFLGKTQKLDDLIIRKQGFEMAEYPSSSLPFNGQYFALRKEGCTLATFTLRYEGANL